MFVVLLKFSSNKEQASEFMAGHNAWLKQGFEDEIFLLAGSIGTGEGGSVFAHNITFKDLLQRVNVDPFVEHNVVVAEIIEIFPKKVDARLAFLSDETA